MKGKLTIFFCFICIFKLYSQGLTDSFDNAIKNLKPIIISNDYIRYGGEIYSAQIYLLNTNKDYNYEVSYLSNLTTKKAVLEDGSYKVEFLAFPGGIITSSKPFEKKWKYNIKISNVFKDTVLVFESKFLIYLPIVRYNSNDTLIAYKNVPTTLNVDYPLYKNLLINKKITFTIKYFDENTMSYIKSDSVDIITTTDTTITFIANKNTPTINIQLEAGGNQFATKIFKILEIPDPKIIAPNSISSSERDFKIELESSDELKYFCKGDSQFIITNGDISLLRKDKIIDTQSINKYSFKSIEVGDIILIRVTECERIILGKKQNVKLNILKLINVI